MIVIVFRKFSQYKEVYTMYMCHIWLKLVKTKERRRRKKEKKKRRRKERKKIKKFFVKTFEKVFVLKRYLF